MPDYKGFLRTMTILHLALTVGQIAFLALCFGLVENPKIEFVPDNDPFFFTMPLTAIIAVVASFFVSRRLISDAAKKDTTTEKLNQYRAALIVRYALIEAASLFAIVCFMLNSNLYFALIAGFLILLLAMMRPTKLKTELDLNIQLPTTL